MAEQNGTAGVGPGALRTFLGIVASRLGLGDRLSTTGSPIQDLEAALGYPATLRYSDYKQRYRRGDIAHTIVRFFPDKTWANPPSIHEDDQEETQTPFEAAWIELSERLNVFFFLETVDLLANIGEYAVLLIGLAGQDRLDQPATPVRRPEDVIYLQPYSQEFATIDELETNAGLATYGKPKIYRLTTGETMQEHRRVQPRSVLVHASRVIHVAEDTLDDQTYAIPRLEPVFNQLYNLVKVVGGAAYGYYLDGRRRFVSAVREGYQLRPEDRQHYEEEVAAYATGLKDFMNVSGMDISQLQAAIASPKEHVDVIINLLSATAAIPKSTLIGAEQGTLASAEQESQGVKERVGKRQRTFAEAVILRPLIDRLLPASPQNLYGLGALPAPAQRYQVDWGNLFALSEPQQADVADKKAAAYNKYEAGRVGALNAGLSPTIPPPEFRETILNLPAESEYALEMPEMLPTDDATGLPADDAQAESVGAADGAAEEAV
jgi:uncharacterized protein